MSRFERWYWFPLFLAISLGIHAAVLLAMRGTGGVGAAASGTEIVVGLVPYDEIASRSLPGRPAKLPSRPAAPAKLASVPPPFSPPEWARRKVQPSPIQEREPVVRGSQIGPAIAAAGTTAPYAGTGSGSPGSGQGGLLGVGALPPRIMRVTPVEEPVRQVTIPSTPAPAPVSRNAFVRARPSQTNPPPPYPDEARAQRQQGTVYLRVAVTADGRADKVDLLFSSGFPMLDEAAISAVRDWSFEPARDESGPIGSQITVPVRFTLN